MDMTVSLFLRQSGVYTIPMFLSCICISAMRKLSRHFENANRKQWGTFKHNSNWQSCQHPSWRVDLVSISVHSSIQVNGHPGEYDRTPSIILDFASKIRLSPGTSPILVIMHKACFSQFLLLVDTISSALTSLHLKRRSELAFDMISDFQPLTAVPSENSPPFQLSSA